MLSSSSTTIQIIQTKHALLRHLFAQMALIMITGIYNGPALEPSPHDCMIAAAICLEDVEAERAADDLSLAGLAAGVGKPTK